jgi:hypothetical protein
MRIHFILVGEGPSEEGLVPHIERLCIGCGADEVIGVAPDFAMIPGHKGHSVAEKLRTVVEYEPSANLIIIHRDADNRDPEPRHREIRTAVEEVELRCHWVAAVPVQETEAWLLVDQDAIRVVAGKPTGKVALGLPSAGRVEELHDAKQSLKHALVTASELSGRRAERFRSHFSMKRRQLLQQLVPGGALEKVPSWRRFRDELATALGSVANLES